MEQELKHVGVAYQRSDGVKKVTGAAEYVDDIRMGRMLYADVVRSPYAHAKVLSVDLSEAKKLPGVKVVIDGTDYQKRVGLYLEDRFFMIKPGDTAKYMGDPIAAVAAETPEIARQACELIKVEYEPLPVVGNVLDGMKPDAPIIHPDLGSYKVAPIFYPKPGTNISHHYVLRKGDCDKAFEEADAVFEHEFYIPHVQHVPLEPHVAMAKLDPDGKLTVWASCQSPYAVRQTLSVAFDMPLNKIRVISPAVGGGFGAKAGTTLEGIVIGLARHCPGRPIKLTYSREDEFVNSYVRQGMFARIKTAMRKDGKMLGVKNEYYWDGGAYTEYGVNITKAGGWASAGPYDIDNVWTDSYCVYTNNPVGGPYRGFGMCEIHFAIEQNIDMIAKKMGISEVEIRRINGLRPGGSTGMGEKMDVAGYQECLEAAIIRMNEDGTFFLMSSGMEIGQGAATVLPQADRRQPHDVLRGKCRQAGGGRSRRQGARSCTDQDGRGQARPEVRGRLCRAQDLPRAPRADQRVCAGRLVPGRLRLWRPGHRCGHVHAREQHQHRQEDGRSQASSGGVLDDGRQWRRGRGRYRNRPHQGAQDGLLLRRRKGHQPGAVLCAVGGRHGAGAWHRIV